MLDLESAIKHCEEVANELTAQGECEECAEEHKQLARWLTDYKDLRQSNIELIEGMKTLEHQYKDATALLEIALCDIERLLNCKSPTKCMDLAKFRSVCFMNGVIGLPNVWRYADEARDLIDKGKINDTYNSCQICGKHISPYKQVCHTCEIKYGIRLGDSIIEKVQEYIKKLEEKQNDNW